jgi:hypothetical protein
MALSPLSPPPVQQPFDLPGGRSESGLDEMVQRCLPVDGKKHRNFATRNLRERGDSLDL